jgi:hypothetical protein
MPFENRHIRHIRIEIKDLTCKQIPFKISTVPIKLCFISAVSHIYKTRHRYVIYTF